MSSGPWLNPSPKTPRALNYVPRKTPPLPRYLAWKPVLVVLALCLGVAVVAVIFGKVIENTAIDRVNFEVLGGG
jgi:hypothetical protein